MKEQLAAMTIIELVRTAHSYATSIQQIDTHSAIVREMASRLEALNLAHIGGMNSLRSAISERDQLAAENAALKAAFKPEVIPGEAVNAFMDTAILDHDWNDTGEWSWVENETDVIRAVLDALVKPETPTTDAWQREQMARGVEKFAEQQRQYIGKPSKNDAASSYCSREAIKFSTQLRQGELS